LCAIFGCAESFSERRINLLRGAARGTFFKPALPAQLVENSEMCKVTQGLVWEHNPPHPSKKGGGEGTLCAFLGTQPCLAHVLAMCPPPYVIIVCLSRCLAVLAIFEVCMITSLIHLYATG
jgi:hypothetical protein